MKKLNKLLILGTNRPTLILVFFVGFFLMAIGILGINSKFFIKRDFNRAFQYRLAGDCDSFSNYINRDTQKWKERCENEKLISGYPIRSFIIKQIAHNFLSDRAFLQVNIIRDNNTKEGYSNFVNYEMKRYGLKWKIDQEFQ